LRWIDILQGAHLARIPTRLPASVGYRGGNGHDAEHETVRMNRYGITDN
jgi:hypothetical protein